MRLEINRAIFLMVPLVAGGLWVTSCKQRELVVIPADKSVFGRLKYVIAGNSAYQPYNQLLNIARLSDTLGSRTNFTVLMYPNLSSYSLGLGYSPTYRQLNPLLSYEILNGKISFDSIAPCVNRSFKTLLGNEVYVSKYKDQRYGRIVTTVNGISVISKDIPALNGYIQIMKQDLVPVILPGSGDFNSTYPVDPNYNTLYDVVRSQPDFVLLAAIIQRADSAKASPKVSALLSGTGPFTFFAPTNAAFQDTGFKYLSIHKPDDIVNVDPDTLANFVKGFIITGRYFIDRLMDTINASKGDFSAAALNNETIHMYLGSQNFNFLNGIFLKAPGNALDTVSSTPSSLPFVADSSQNSATVLTQQGIPTGNGNMFYTNKILVPKR